MAEASESADTAVAQATKQILIEVAVEVLSNAGFPIPKPAIRVLVNAIVNAVSEIDLDTIRRVVQSLPMPVPIYLADRIWDLFTDRVEETSEVCEVECPHSGDAITLEEGPGTYECPDCGWEIEVNAGAAEHDDLPEVVCPESGDSIALVNGPGTYPCPDCGADIDAEDADAVHPAPRYRRARRKK